MNYLSHNKLSDRHSGFSLIEALVAFMIISVGMLGIASLQTISMKAGHTAVTRTMAVFNVEDILDRMRANTTQIAAYAVDVTGTGTDGSCSDIVGSYSSPGAVTTATAGCTSAQLAADDIFHWKRSLGQNVQASIVVTPPVAPLVLNTVTVNINWTERSVSGTNLATANNFSVTVEI